MSDSAARAVEVCTYCPGLCRFACPVEAAAMRETASPRAQVALRHHLATGLLAWGPELARGFSFCDGCGACTAVCEHGNQVAAMLYYFRGEARARGLGPAAAGRLAENLAAGLGPGGGLLDAALSAVHPERQGLKAPLLLWPSDRGLEAGPDSLLASCALLEALGLEYALPVPAAMGPSPAAAAEIGAGALAAELTARLAQASAGYARVLFEDWPGKLVPAAVAWWELGPEPRLELPGGSGGVFLAPAAQGPGFAAFARGLGLKDLNEGRAPALSASAGSVFDLLEPELAARMAAAVAARAEGRKVLVPTPAAAARLRAAGVDAVAPHALRPRPEAVAG